MPLCGATNIFNFFCLTKGGEGSQTAIAGLSLYLLFVSLYLFYWRTKTNDAAAAAVDVSPAIHRRDPKKKGKKRRVATAEPMANTYTS
jgi:hypothetical protein